MVCVCFGFAAVPSAWPQVDGSASFKSAGVSAKAVTAFLAVLREAEAEKAVVQEAVAEKAVDARAQWADSTNNTPQPAAKR